MIKNTCQVKTMSISGKLGPMAEHRIQFAFKGKREHIAKANTPNIRYPAQKIDIGIPQRSIDHFIVPDTIKITFNLEIGSTDKERSVVNNVGKALLKKKSSYLVQKRLTQLITLIFMTRIRIFP